MTIKWPDCFVNLQNIVTDLTYCGIIHEIYISHRYHGCQENVIEITFYFNGVLLPVEKGVDMAQTELKVLIVDDDEDMRATLSDFIGGMGVQVRVAADVAEARRTLSAEPSPFDLVLADLKLPGGTGLDILKAAHDRSSETLVTIVTGYASLETAIEAIRLGAYDYITKPFSLDEIAVQVRNMVQRVLLAKENARLSLRLQELLEQVNRLHSERADLSRFQDDVRRELQDTNRKLEQFLATGNFLCPLAQRPASGPAEIQSKTSPTAPKAQSS
jgi:DNA-binding response OmpR family regulator